MIYTPFSTRHPWHNRKRPDLKPQSFFERQIHEMMKTHHADGHPIISKVGKHKVELVDGLFTIDESFETDNGLEVSVYITDRQD